MMKQKINLINYVGLLCLVMILTFNVEAQVKKVNVNAVLQNANTGKTNKSIPPSAMDQERERLNKIICFDLYALHNRCQIKCYEEYYTCVEACTSIDDFDDRIACRDTCVSEHQDRYDCVRTECDSKYFTQACPDPLTTGYYNAGEEVNSSGPKAGSSINVTLSDIIYGQFRDPKLMEKLKLKTK